MKTFTTIFDFLAANSHRFEQLPQKSEEARRIIAACRGTTQGELFALHGVWAHEKALSAGLRILSFCICPTITKWPNIMNLATRFMDIAERSYTITERTFARISDYGDPDGIISVAQLPLVSPDAIPLSSDSVVFVMDGLVKPGNIGVILRSCDGAGVSAVIATNLRTRITHPNAIKASMGATFSIPIAEFPNAHFCKEWLLLNGFTIYIADPNVKHRYDRLSYPGRVAVILGNEHVGPSQTWYEGDAQPLSIPMRGSCDSLNVSVAAAILAYEIRSRKDGVTGC